MDPAQAAASLEGGAGWGGASHCPHPGLGTSSAASQIPAAVGRGPCLPVGSACWSPPPSGVSGSVRGRGELLPPAAVGRPGLVYVCSFRAPSCLPVALRPASWGVNEAVGREAHTIVCSTSALRSQISEGRVCLC